jgi:hypothetical protein
MVSPSPPSYRPICLHANANGKGKLLALSAQITTCNDRTSPHHLLKALPPTTRRTIWTLVDQHGLTRDYGRSHTSAIGLKVADDRRRYMLLALTVEAPWLTSHAEIRNRIYDYAVPSEPTKLIYDPYHYFEEPHWASLRQVCRQTRCETLPLYVDAEIVIPWHKVEDYVRTQFPSQDPATMSKYRANLALDLGYKMGIAVDLLPLLRLRLYAPLVRITLQPSTRYLNTYCYVLQRLLDGALVSPSFQSALLTTRHTPSHKDDNLQHCRHENEQDEQRAFWYGQSLSKVLVHPPACRPTIEFHFKREFRKSWMWTVFGHLTEEYSKFEECVNMHNMGYINIETSVELKCE